MKLEVPVKVDIDDVTKLIHDLQCLQTYKLGVNDTMVLVSLDDVADVFADHIRAKRLDKDIDVPSKWIPVSERLPEEGQGCLVCDKGQILIDTFIGHGNPYNWRWYVRDYEAWMPLPEPWEGEADGQN